MAPGPSIPLIAAVSSEDVAEILIWSAVLVGLVILLAVVMVLAKRKSGSDPGKAAPFTLGELRKLRDEGQLTDEEYQRARNGLIGMANPQAGTDQGTAAAAQPGREPGTGGQQPGQQPPDRAEGPGSDRDDADDEPRDGNGDQRGA